MTTSISPSRRYLASVLACALVTISLGTASQSLAAEVPSPVAADSFSRTLVSSWGSADAGGAWSACSGSCSAMFQVRDGDGVVSVAAGKGPEAYLGGVSVMDADASVTIATDRPATGGGTYVSLAARGNIREGYRGKVHISSQGRVALSLVKVVAAKETVLASTTLAGVTFGAAQDLRIRVQATGSLPTTLRAKAWLAGTPEPAQWMLTASDVTPELQKAGTAGVVAYVSTSATNGPAAISFDDFVVTDPTRSLVAPNKVPVAGFSAAVSDLAVSVDGSASVDSDGSIASYVWDFGDGSSATGKAPAAHAYGKGGTYVVKLTVTDDRGGVASATKSVSVVAATPPPPPAGQVGARLPVSYSLSSLAGTVRYVSPTGSDTAGTGSVSAPFRTLGKAEAASADGDTIVLRGGTYPIVGNAVSIDRARLTVIAYPGEVPVFDGSIAAPVVATSEGTLKYFAYQPMPAAIGQGVLLANLPAATFAGSSPNGLAASRGWRCVTGSATYTVPAPTASDPDGCAGDARVVTAFYPDQVWVDGRALTQVADKSLVVPGTFWVPRTSATDGAPGMASMYLSATDAADMSKVRVSSSAGNFMHVAADGVRLEGFRVQRHSPSWGYHALVVTSGVDDLIVRDVALDHVAGISLNLSGGSAAGGAKLDRRSTFDHLSVTNAGWMGSLVNYADDLTVTGSLFDKINSHQDFSRGPVSGAMKVTKTHRMKVVDSVVSNVWGHALWWDQSNYDVTVANNRLSNNSHSSIFFEISHGLTVVNNKIIALAGDPGTEGHSAIRIAGSSGVRLVNNTVIGAPVGVGVYTDPRSKKYDSDGNGSLDRLCSEHAVRYGGGGDAKTACNVPYTSDFDYARPGAYGPAGTTNLTPALTWSPGIEMMVNNVIANQTGPLSSGWTPCGGRTPVCVYTYLGSPAVDVAGSSIFKTGAIMNGNVYQSTGTRIMAVIARSGSASDGALSAPTLADLRTAFAGSHYGLSVEANGKSGPGWVDASGAPTSQLSSANGQAAPVPVDAKINTYVPANSRDFGSSL